MFKRLLGMPALIGVSAATMLLASAPPALAQGSQGSIESNPLPPLTKLRLSIVQFVPTTGDYRRWDALGGDLQVSPDGTISVPSLGTLPVGASQPDQLADEIASRLQQKLGLVDRPDASIQVVEYPPVFLSGAVTTPGQYPFRPGMTVLQAVALAGGEFRDNTSRGTKGDVLNLKGQLQTTNGDIMRSQARLARLQAQLEGRHDIALPPGLDLKNPDVAAIVAQEQAILDAQENEVSRQVSALNDLSSLFKAQIDVLAQKADSINEQIGETQHQLDGVKDLVSKGVVVATRQSDLERSLSGLKGDLLDNTIATMSARQGLSGAMRDLAKLVDDQRSTISADLQTAQINLTHLQISQTTTVQLLQLAGRQSLEPTDEMGQQTAQPIYTIVRVEAGQPTQIAATEQSPLLPGDVLQVEVPAARGAAGNGFAAPRTAVDAAGDL